MPKQVIQLDSGLRTTARFDQAGRGLHGEAPVDLCRPEFLRAFIQVERNPVANPG